MADVRKLKEKATEAFTKGKFAKAAEAYGEYCKADPKDLQARLRMGDAWAKSGKKEKAIEAYVWAAEGFAKEGFLPRAIAASKLILELDPSHNGVQKMLADLYARKTGPAGPGAPPKGGPAKVETKIDTQTTATGFADRKDAIELDARPEPAPAKKGPAPKTDAPPSPMNRADAIELPEYEVPGAETAASGSSFVPLATKGPRPTNRADAIELEEEAEVRRGPGPLSEARIELDVGMLPPPPPAPSAPKVELELEVVDPVEVEVPIVDAPPPAPVSYELEVDSPAPSYELEVAAPVPPPAPSAPEPVWDLDSDAIVESVPAPAVEFPPEPPRPPIDLFSKPALEVVPRPQLEVVAAPKLEVLDEPRAAAGPPGLRPRRSEATTPAAAAPTSDAPPRIWLPGNFAAPAATDAPAAAAPIVPSFVPEGSENRTDLERGLEIFSRFDADDFAPAKPVAPAPPPAPAPVEPPRAAASRRSFTELELEGDSLLHAVEEAAAVGLEQRGQHAGASVEEVMELPEDAKVAPGELPKIPLFSDLPPDAFIALFERCPLKRAEPGEIVIQQGSLGDSFYVICAGSVRVFRTDGEQRREIATLEEGAFFGEMALLSGAARTASVEAATEDTQLLEISAPLLTELSLRYPQVATALKKFCRQRLLSNLMNSSALFQPFSRNDRRDLVQRFRARDVAKGEVLIKEGHPSDGMYVILSGEVEVRVGAKQVVASLKEGEVFGEMSLLTKALATASVAASKRTSLLRLPREDFDRIIMSHPQVLVLVSELTDARAKQNANSRDASGMV
jgi:CRP-like cAMP-binding protein